MSHALVTIDQETALHSASARLAAEFGDRIDISTIENLLRSSHEKLASTATVPNYLPLLAEKFARQRLRALDRADSRTENDAPAVLFLCVQNAGRSQMALGFLQHYAGENAIGWSGGSAPGGSIDPVAVEVMAEKGIDITGEYPKPWTDEVVRASDVVVSMGCGDACPVLPGKRYVDWDLADPAGQDAATVRSIRDDIEQRVLGLLGELGVSPQR